MKMPKITEVYKGFLFTCLISVILLFSNCIYASTNSVLFKAYVDGSISAEPGVNIPFTTTQADYNIGGGWKNDTHKFIAPVTGYYHFDVTINLETTDYNRSSRFVVELKNYRAHYRTYPLFALRLFNTNVSTRPNQNAWSPSGFLLTGNGGLDLYMRSGDEVYIQLTGSSYDGITLNGKASNDSTFFSYITGHLFESGNNIANDENLNEPSVGSTETRIETTYDIHLVSIGKDKISTIKLIRKITNKSLKQSEAILSKLPVSIGSKKSLTEANDIAIEFQRIGVLTKILQSK
ncbi:MAG: complement C1q domain-containing protein [Candidatus Scalindua sp.]|nr:complement C1q domain-containing protein [Candidatus Scalindua sp.]